MLHSWGKENLAENSQRVIIRSHLYCRVHFWIKMGEGKPEARSRDPWYEVKVPESQQRQ